MTLRVQIKNQKLANMEISVQVFLPNGGEKIFTKGKGGVEDILFHPTEPILRITFTDLTYIRFTGIKYIIFNSI